MFAYCLNNPVILADPTGEIAITTLILIGSAIVGAACAGYTAYTTYNAGWETGDILWYSFGAGLGGFLTGYTFGISAYQLYLNYCTLNGIVPVTEVSVSNNTVAVYGASSAPDQGIPNSTYNKIDQDGTTIVSTTQYNENGYTDYRIDYYTGTDPHTHFDKITQTLYYSHVHCFMYNERNQVCNKYVIEFK